MQDENAFTSPASETASGTSESQELDRYAYQDECGNELYYDELMEPHQKEAFAGLVGMNTYCRNCNVHFSSNNLLHKHLRNVCAKSRLKEPSDIYFGDIIVTTVTETTEPINPTEPKNPTEAAKTLSIVVHGGQYRFRV